MKWICEPDCSIPENAVKDKGWTLMTGILVMLMPKCAFCWAAYMNILSSAGLIMVPYHPWFLAVAVVLFLLTLAKLLYGAVRSGRFTAFILALTAGILIILQKFWMPVSALNYIALVMMTVAVMMEYFFKLFKYRLKL